MISRRLGLLAAALAFTAFIKPASAVDVVVRFDPPVESVPVGTSFTIDIVADLYRPVVGWGLDLQLLTPGIISMTAPPVVGQPWIPASSSDGDDLVGLASPFPPVHGSVSGLSVVLATLSFHADAIGETLLQSSTTPGDLTEGFPLDLFGFGDVHYETGHVMVTPEPAASLMLFVSCVLLRRRQRSIPGEMDTSRVEMKSPRHLPGALRR